MTRAPESGGSDLMGTLIGVNNGLPIWRVITGVNGSYKFYGP